MRYFKLIAWSKIRTSELQHIVPCASSRYLQPILKRGTSPQAYSYCTKHAMPLSRMSLLDLWQIPIFQLLKPEASPGQHFGTYTHTDHQLWNHGRPPLRYLPCLTRARFGLRFPSLTPSTPPCPTKPLAAFVAALSPGILAHSSRNIECNTVLYHSLPPVLTSSHMVGGALFLATISCLHIE